MTLPRIAAVQPVPPTSLKVNWVSGATDIVDLRGLIEGFPPFKPLSDREQFMQVQVVEHGTGVEWANGLDYAADSLAELAAQQRAMSGEEFHHWCAEIRISIRETAVLFGVSPSTVKLYRKAARVPVAWQIACAAMRANPNLFYAHFSPSRPGRPPKRSPA